MNNLIVLLFSLLWKFIKLSSVIFLLLVIFDLAARTIFFSSDFMTKEYAIVKKYQTENYVILNSLLYKFDNNRSFSLRYSVIPKNLEYPYLLTINGNTKFSEKNGLIIILISISFLILGGGSLYRFLKIYGNDFRIGTGGGA